MTSNRAASRRLPAPSARSRMGRSRSPAVSTTVPPASTGVRQLDLSVEPRYMVRGPEPGPRRLLLPHVVHVPGWLELGLQRELVERFREWALPPAGLRHPRVPSGALMSVQSVCLGWHWQPYAYSLTADDTDGAPVKPLPNDLVELGKAAVAAAYSMDHPESVSYNADAAILNLYGPGARLGLHQDGEEPSSAPVVTISLGDSCVFRLAGVGRRTGPFIDVTLASGDLLVFGGPNRRIYHGVSKVLPGSGPDVGLPPGRLSITLRETGLNSAAC